MTYKQYEQAMGEARGDADAMLGASCVRIQALERVLAELVDTTSAMCPVDHRAFQKACDLLPPSACGQMSPAKAKSLPKWDGPPWMYNPAYGDNRVCLCGHEYRHHFNSKSGTTMAVCKHCDCFRFEEASK